MFLRVVALAALLFAPLQAPAPAKPDAPAAALPDAREIINRHIKAVGGRDAILARKSMHAVGTLTLPANGMNGPIEIFGAAPNLLLVKMTVGGIGEILEGYDGTHGWSVNPMTGPALKVGPELDQAKLDADFYQELRDPKTYPTVKTLGREDFDGRPCYKVSLKRIDGHEDIDYYDVATGLRAGTEVTRDTPMGPMTQIGVEGGYKKFGTLLQATTLSVKSMGVEQRMEMTTIEYDKVDKSSFDPPAAIKALLK